MKKDKLKAQQKAQLKANRKQAEKAVKAALITELTTLIGTFAEPTKKLKKLVAKAAATFSKEIDKTAKPVIETEGAKTEENAVVTDKKVSKPRNAKKTEKEAKE